MEIKNSLRINKADGSITLKNFPIVIKKGITKEEVAQVLTLLYRSTIDYKNGKQWLFFEGMEFCDCPCNLGLFFVDDHLTQVKLTLTPVHSDRSKSGWSSDETISEAVVLCLIELRVQLSRPFKEGRERFDWGEAWCVPDIKRSEMDAGIKYT